jgi:hypothetical protein
MALVLFAGSGCAGTEESQLDAGGDVGILPDSPDAEASDVEHETPALATLQARSRGPLSLAPGEAVDLEVLLVDAHSAPIVAARVTFELDDRGAGGAALSTPAVSTDSDGIAGVQLVAGSGTAEFDVIARADSAPGSPTTAFRVIVRPNPNANYLIQVAPELGDVQLDHVDVFVFDDGATCAETARSVDAISAAFDTVRLAAHADGTLDPYEYSAPDGVSLTRAVGVGYAGDVAVGFGCAAAAGPSDGGGDAVFEMALDPLYPEVSGTFRVTTHLGITDSLPPGAAHVVGRLGALASSPGATLYGVAADLGVFDVDDRPLDLETTFIVAVDRLFAETLGPDGVSALVAGDALSELVRSVRMTGELRVFERMDERGELGSCNELALDRLTIGADSAVELGVTSLGYEALYAPFTGWMHIRGGDVPQFSLNLRPFEVEVDHGAIALMVFEAAMLPQILGPDVDGIDGLVASVLDCEAIATHAGWPALTDLCPTLHVATATGLRAMLREGAADTTSVYVLATPSEGTTPPPGIDAIAAGIDWAPCVVSIERSGNDATVVALGSQETRCAFGARLRQGASDPTGTPVLASFVADRVATRVEGVCGDGE